MISGFYVQLITASLRRGLRDYPPLRLSIAETRGKLLFVCNEQGGSRLKIVVKNDEL